MIYQKIPIIAVVWKRALQPAAARMNRARLEALDCEVVTYDGAEISVKGQGGLTCLTRPSVKDNRMQRNLQATEPAFRTAWPRRQTFYSEISER